MKRIPILLFLLALILAACMPPLLVPPGTPSPEPGPPREVTPVPTEPSDTPTLPMSEVPDEILKLAYAELSTRLGVKWTDITLVSGEQVDFPDSCLGINTPGMACLDVITPGYRIQLQSGSAVYTYHTDLAGSRVILAGSAGPSTQTTPMYDREVLSWSREGGIAGFCDEIVIYGSGWVKVTSCKAVPHSFQLTAEQKTLLDGWLAKFGTVDYVEDNPQALADRMTVKLNLAGAGTLKPNEDEIKQLLEFASKISLER